MATRRSSVKRVSTADQAPAVIQPGAVGARALEEARRAGLLEGERSEHVSFRAPKALLDAARREAGAISPTELGLTALALLAQTDATAIFLKNTYGCLGPDHDLDY